MTKTIAFIDLAAQQARLRGNIDAAIAKVLDHGQYIMGPEVARLESRLAEFAGSAHVISCSSGTDALLLGLMAKGVGPGDAIIVPTFSFAATAEAVALLGAVPIFADILPDTLNLDPAAIPLAVQAAAECGLTAKGVIPVDLFGLPADYPTIQAVAHTLGLFVMADSAQSFGSSLDGRRTGVLAELTATSFFPAKPLGCYGDGGAVFTNDADLATAMMSLRVHGQGRSKYDNVRIGLNARLDTIQAAILLEKLSVFADEIDRRNQIARTYAQCLGDSVRLPQMPVGTISAWAQYTIRVTGRDRIAARLREDGIPTAIYYPLPLHRQTAYRGFPVAGGNCPAANAAADEVLSLPMHPYLPIEDIERIALSVRRAVG